MNFSKTLFLCLFILFFSNTVYAEKVIPFKLKQKSQQALSVKELVTQTEDFIFEKTNTWRAGKKANTLGTHKLLVQVARNYSQEMLKKNFLSHTNSKGETVLDRIHKLKKNYDEDCGENLHMIQSAEQLTDPEAIAKQMMQDWIQSPSHKKNLISKDFELLGVGCASNGHRIYCTQVFSGSEI